jgi:hypothetical protein
MKQLRWYINLSAVLIGTSLLFYLAQILIFHKPEDTFFYLIQDIAFVPIQVLLVTLLIARLLNEREKRTLMKKLNMLIGAFYSEAGSDLIKYLSGFRDFTELSKHLLIRKDWARQDFAGAISYVRAFEPGLDSRIGDISKLKSFLSAKRDFLLGLLANPNLLEHDTFTDLLWAVLHLSEELCARENLEGLPDSDYDHLTGDMERAYVQLLVQWLSYMEHLKDDYPYLFSLGVRMNPLNINASAVVKS